MAVLFNFNPNCVLFCCFFDGAFAISTPSLKGSIQFCFRKLDYEAPNIVVRRRCLLAKSSQAEGRQSLSNTFKTREASLVSNVGWHYFFRLDSVASKSMSSCQFVNIHEVNKLVKRLLQGVFQPKLSIKQLKTTIE